ncbi:MAG: ATP-dependent DNA helicase RecG, partial [Bacteroidales bacterium]|nr:ATP-dependent DNA helicase RecG [Bacteroidales bacterium]
MNKILESDIKFLQGVGPKRAALLEKELGISTFRDMLYTFPFRYIDRTRFYSIREIDSSSAYIQLRGSITDLRIVGEGRAKRLIARLYDGTGTIELVFFQGIKWISGRLKIGTEYIVFGKPSIFNQTYNMVHPEIDPATEDKLAMVGTLIGVYSSTERLRSAGIGNKVFAKLQYNLINQVIESIEETLPRTLLLRKRFISLRQALVNIHFPTDLQILDKAKDRLKFEELFYLQLSLLKQKNIRMRSSTGILFNTIGEAFNST